MATRDEFAQRIAAEQLTHSERAIAYLWYYDYAQEYDERSPAELASDLAECGFPKPHVTKLSQSLRESSVVVRGRRSGTFRLDIRKKGKLDELYLPMVDKPRPKVGGSILDPIIVFGTRRYLEQLVFQINGSYEYGFYDCTAVLCRRLMESLLIEIYISQKRTAEIRAGSAFLPLERLIAYIKSDPSMTLSRGLPKTMEEIKQLGDVAAHDRVYITQKDDIDDVKLKFRRLIQELLMLSGIVP